MENIVTQRFNEFRKSLGLSILGLSKQINVGQATLNKQTKDDGCGVSISTIVKTLEAYPNLSAEWLLRGEGTMERGAVQDLRVRDEELVAALRDNIEALKESNALLREKVRRLEAGEKDPVASCAGYGFIAAEGSVKELVP